MCVQLKPAAVVWLGGGALSIAFRIFSAWEAGLIDTCCGAARGEGFGVPLASTSRSSVAPGGNFPCPCIGLSGNGNRSLNAVRWVGQENKYWGRGVSEPRGGGGTRTHMGGTQTHKREYSSPEVSLKLLALRARSPWFPIDPGSPPA